MRLEKCDLNIDLVVSAPVMRTEPEPEWLAARDSRVLPLAAFALYSRASFLSFGGAPPFLSDEKKFLFSYFSMLLRSVKESLTDADEELKMFIEAQGQVYAPGKKMRGEPWDLKADDRARRHFRLLLADVAGNVRYWGIVTRRETLVTHRPDKVYAVEFSPDGKALAYAGEETTIGFIQTD